MDEFNVYADYIDDNNFATLPFLSIPETQDDIFIEWNVGNRLDKLAYTYYNNAALGKFILLANPSFISEGDINVGDILRIPMTKEVMLNSIRNSIKQHKKF